jgi:hypothetical protein
MGDNAKAKNHFGQKLPKGWRELGHDTDGKFIGIEPYCGDCRIGVRGESYCTCGKAYPVEHKPAKERPA